MWLAKYEAWIPGHPEHALVYVNDEQKHGVGFPRELDAALADRLKELLTGRRFPALPTSAVASADR